MRKAGLQLLSAVAHAKPGLLAGGLLAPIVPALFEQTKVNKALIRIVDLGPFKHQIDDGLELRKAAYECLDVLLDRGVEGISPGDVADALLGGLADHYDVKMRCHLLVIKVAGIAPGAVASRLDRLVEPLTGTLTARVKADAVQQEVDRNEDLLRSCLRAIHSLSKLPGAAGVAGWKAFMEGVVTGPEAMRVRYGRIKEERKEVEGEDAMDMS